MTEDITEGKPPVAAEIREYLDLDLSAEGSLAQTLLAKAPAEAKNEELPLSDLLGALPANLTAEMRNWYQIHIAPRRGAAISAICQHFTSNSALDQAQGFVLQLREGSLDERLLHDKRTYYDQHNERFQSDTQKIRELHGKLTDARRRYAIRKAQVGQDAKLLNVPLYFSVLVLVIFGAEAALNLEAFQALPWATPFIAWGATVLIGLAIGLAAHYHGTVMKQYAYYFGAAVDDTRRGPALRMFALGCTALSAALAFVYYARSAYLAAYLSSVGNFEQGSQDGASFLWVVGGSLLGNMLVYLTGVLWAYMLHDADPEYVELREDIIKFEKSLHLLESRMEKIRVRTLEQLNAIHRRDVEAARRAYSSFSADARFRLAHELFTGIQKQDQAVVGLLEAYRSRLIENMADTRKTHFVACTDGAQIRYEHISPVEYQRRSIRLKYLEV